MVDALAYPIVKQGAGAASALMPSMCRFTTVATGFVLLTFTMPNPTMTWCAVPFLSVNEQLQSNEAKIGSAKKNFTL